MVRVLALGIELDYTYAFWVERLDAHQSPLCGVYGEERTPPIATVRVLAPFGPLFSERTWAAGPGAAHGHNPPGQRHLGEFRRGVKGGASPSPSLHCLGRGQERHLRVPAGVLQPQEAAFLSRFDQATFSCLFVGYRHYAPNYHTSCLTLAHIAGL